MPFRRRLGVREPKSGAPAAGRHCLRPWHLIHPRAMQASEQTNIHSEAFLRSLMRKQMRLSVACAAAFLIALLGLPLANYFWPEIMARRIFGFTLTWLLLGIAFFPFVWVIAWLFIKRSIALEDEEVAAVSGKNKSVSE